jgi:hypothetical protein
MPVEYTEKFERHRIIDPSYIKKSSFRTHDIGKKGFSKRIAGQLKGTNKWVTQSLLISVDEPQTMKKKLRDDARRLKKRMQEVI